jgi:uncharacterized protein
MNGEEMLWRRLDGPGHEYARLSHDDMGWRLAGVAVFQHEQRPCRLDYTVLCDDQWLTQAGWVTGRVGDRNINIEISVDIEGFWCVNDVACKAVAGCIDLDLNFSPSTNLLPIQRLKLSTGVQTTVMAAWLRFPEFTLEPLEQIYRRVDQETYHYETGGAKFMTELKVNSAGFVTLYPNFWEAES